MNIKNIAFLEILLVFVSIFSFAYLMEESNYYFEENIYQESEFFGEFRELLDIVGDFFGIWWAVSKIGVVSAQSLWTCPINKNGTTCQEYPPGNDCGENEDCCGSQCAVSCLPGPVEDFSICELGMCLDTDEGTCQANTPHEACTNAGGNWFKNPPAQCNLGCCLINPLGDGFADETKYVTSLTCNTIGENTGTPVNWVNVENELECLFLAGAQEEGACVFEEEFENNCKFGSKTTCYKMGGDFYKDKLCSHPDLDTICERQVSISCAEFKEEVYWFDSCGNRENIYDANKARGWNGGLVLSKEDSCNLPNSDKSNFNNKQKTCGNCHYLFGSICGEPGSKDNHIVDNKLGDYVCGDLSCVDEWGKERKNGESWCAFDGQIGVENDGEPNKERSVDVPGSRHYRKVCLDGEVRTEQCADFRNEVCVEQRDEDIRFSSAACRLNQWQLCLEANTDEDKLVKCEKNTDCSLHSIEIDQFKFNICTPKYPPGFDLKSNLGADVGEGICSAASQTCTMIEVKGLSGWKCKANCDCENSEFTEAMNNLCISLGDCGGHANINREYTDDGYRINDAPKLNSIYIDSLKRLADAKKNQRVEALSGKELASLFGVPKSTFENEDKFANFIGKIGIGASGVLFTLGTLKLGVPALVTAFKTQGALNAVANTMGSGISSVPGLGAYAGAAGGAFLGAAVGNLIGKAFGLQSDAILATTLTGLITGIIAGAGIGAGIVGTIGAGSTVTAGAAGLTGTVAASSTTGVTIIPAGQGVAFGTSYLPGTSFAAGPGATITAVEGSSFSIGSGGGVISAGEGVGTAVGPAGTGAGVAPLLSIIITIVIVVIIVAIIMKLLGIGKTRKKTVEFVCLPWQPPNSGSSCDKCNDDNLPCSKYKCHSLGQTCELINEGTSEELCVDISPNDVTPPVIEADQNAKGWGIKYKEIKKNGFEIDSTETDDGCLPEYSAVAFGVKLNEPGQCKIEFEHTSDYDAMTNFIGGRNIFVSKHSQILSVPTLESLGVSGVSPERRGEVKMYIRCSDTSGISNVQEYTINTCVRPGDDLTPSRILFFDPPSPSYASVNLTEKFVQFYTNEPAECNWDLEDREYGIMSNTSLCYSGIDEMKPLGWLCSVFLPIVEGEEDTNYHFRCKDQPWLEDDDDEENDANRNVNTQSAIYTLKKSLSELLINSVIPNNESIVIGGGSISVDLKIHTEGGANGNALCKYSFNDDLFYGFRETGGNVHLQTFTNLFEGDYNISLMCTDVADNVAVENSIFNIEIDDVGPEITRVYDFGGLLYVITDESAQCAYEFNGCGFNFENGTLINGADSIHTTSFDSSLNYHIKCQDTHKNPGSCIVVTGGYA